MTWIITIAGIIALIVLHELGHFLAAKAVGMRVERFSLFFPPTVAKVRRGETEYAIGAIPAGGYVKITGMSPQELEGLPPEVAARAYYNQPVWKRVVVILAGPAVNIAIAFVIFWALLWAGSLRGDIALSNITNGKVDTVAVSSSVGSVEKGSPAATALRSGDRLVSVDGVRADPATVVRKVSAHSCAGGAKVNGCVATTPVTLVVSRGGRTQQVSVYPRYDTDLKRMRIGFGFGVAPAAYGPIGAAAASTSSIWHITEQTLTGIGRALTSSKARAQLHSIVGITVDTQQAVASGAPYALVIIAFVSLALGVINLFPFLPLDGGHILWSVAEKVRGRRISALAMARFSSVGVVLLVFLVISGLSNDISQLTGSGIH